MANKQAKRQGKAKRAPTEQPNAQKHAQPANVRPMSKQTTCGKPCNSAYRASKSTKNMHNQQTCGQSSKKTQGNAKGAPTDQPNAQKHAQPANEGASKNAKMHENHPGALTEQPKVQKQA